MSSPPQFPPPLLLLRSDARDSQVIWKIKCYQCILNLLSCARLLQWQTEAPVWRLYKAQKTPADSHRAVGSSRLR